MLKFSVLCFALLVVLSQACTSNIGCRTYEYCAAGGACEACPLVDNCKSVTCIDQTYTECSVCNEGYEKTVDGSCSDRDECSSYTCSFMPSTFVSCSNSAVNQRTCTCLYAVDPIESSQVLNGSEFFGGCGATSQELKLIDHMNSLVAYSTTFNTLVRELYGISVYNLRVRNGNLTFTMAFSDSTRDADTAQLNLQDILSDTFNVDRSSVQLFIIASSPAKRSTATSDKLISKKRTILIYQASAKIVNYGSASGLVPSLAFALVATCFFALLSFF